MTDLRQLAGHLVPGRLVRGSDVQDGLRFGRDQTAASSAADVVLVYDHPALPSELRDRMYEHCRQNFPDERKPSDTEPSPADSSKPEESSPPASYGAPKSY